MFTILSTYAIRDSAQFKYNTIFQTHLYLDVKKRMMKKANLQLLMKTHELKENMLSHVCFHTTSMVAQAVDWTLIHAQIPFAFKVTIIYIISINWLYTMLHYSMLYLYLEAHV